MKKQHICILGGTGFVGRHLLAQLAKQGHHAHVLTRHPERHQDLRVLAGVELIKADVHDVVTLRQQFKNMDAVINLVGILNERRDNGKGFYHVHVELVKKIIRACKDQGVSRLLHMSALNADPARGSSYYLRSKGEAEQQVHAATGIAATSFRPSVIFGPEDSFTNRFAELLRKTPYFLPLACGYSRFAPVFVEDVARAFALSLEMPDTIGQRYDLCGPHTYTLREIVKYINELLKLNRLVNPLGDVLSRLQAEVLEHVPGKPFSRDNFRSLQTDSVCTIGANALLDVFGITPTAMEAEVSSYLLHQSRTRSYDLLRQHAGRDASTY